MYVLGMLYICFVFSAVYQGLIRTCSHPVVTTAANDDDSGQGDYKTYSAEGERQRISYRDYFSLWKYLLESAKVKVCSFMHSFDLVSTQ